MNSIIGTYKAIKAVSVRCGISCFTLTAGAEVAVTQIDNEYRKVLIKFGARDADWFDESFLKNFEPLMLSQIMADVEAAQ